MKVHITAEVSEKHFTEGDTKTYKTIVSGLNVWVVDLGKNNRPDQELHFDETPF